MKKIVIGLLAMVAVILITGNVNARVTLLHPERSSDQFRPGTFIEVTGSGFVCSSGAGRFIPFLSFEGVDGAFDDFAMFVEVVSRTDTYLKFRIPGYDSYNFNNDDNPFGSMSALDEETRDAIERRRLRLIANLVVSTNCSGGMESRHLGMITVAPPPTTPEIYELSPLDITAGRTFWIYGSGFNSDSTVVYVGRDGVPHEIVSYFENSTLVSAYFPETTPRAVYTIYVRNPSEERSRSPAYMESNGIGINVMAKIIMAPREYQMQRRTPTPTYEIAPATGATVSPMTPGGSDDKKKK